MPHKPQAPLTCLITAGETTADTGPPSGEFIETLSLVGRAVAAGVSIVQLREKRLTARALFELASRAAAFARDSATLILVNDRADIARASGCHGVQLTTRSLDARVVRRAFGPEFVIGVSTHSPAEARAARDGGADFALYGPVFDTPSKRAYGPPVGLEALRETARDLSPFPLLALGGVARESVPELLRAGAAGVAAIRMFVEAADLDRLARAIREAAPR